jgi:hypothetical protein
MAEIEEKITSWFRKNLRSVSVLMPAVIVFVGSMAL